jgi:hypothetical protein
MTVKQEPGDLFGRSENTERLATLFICVAANCACRSDDAWLITWSDDNQCKIMRAKPIYAELISTVRAPSTE